MKFFYILFLATFIVSSINAQHGYEFDSYQSEYSNLEEATVLTEPTEGWEGEETPVDFGFPFKFNETIYSSFELVFGEIYFEDETGIIAGYVGGLLEGQNFDATTGLSNQPISFIVEGEVGSRILKLEIKNANSYSDPCLGNGMPEACHYVNLQYWLFEGSNVIEIHYGPNNFPLAYFVENELVGPTVILEFNLEDEYMYLTGDPLDPTVLTEESAMVDDVGLWPSPADGTVFRFAPMIDAVKNKSIKKVEIYPSPVKDKLFIQINNQDYNQVKVVDINGVDVLFETRESNIINVSKLASGLYFITLYQNDKLIGINKFIKN